MNWYLIIGWFALLLEATSIIVMILSIGKPRGPIEATAVAVSVLINAPIMVWIWAAIHR